MKISLSGSCVVIFSWLFFHHAAPDPLDMMDSQRMSILSSLKGEFKQEDYIQPHYKEAYRLAIDHLLNGGRERYQEFLKEERIGSFLSEEELLFITANAQTPAAVDQAEEFTHVPSDSHSSTGTYWPMHSDVVTPDLELGWPEVMHERLQTSVDMLYHPPRLNSLSIKEVIRKHIQDARQVTIIMHVWVFRRCCPPELLDVCVLFSQRVIRQFSFEAVPRLFCCVEE